MDSIQLLLRSTLLRLLEPSELLAYTQNRRVRVVSYDANSVIHFEGDPCECLEVILSGQVVIERIDEGGRLLTVAEFLADTIIGGNQLFSRSPYYPMTVTARRPSVIGRIDRESLFELLCKNSRFLRLYLQMVSDNASALGSRIRHYAHKSLRESLLSYLSQESKRQGSSRVQLTMSKKALAERLGVQRTSISRELAKMSRDGLVLVDGRYVTLVPGVGLGPYR